MRSWSVLALVAWLGSAAAAAPAPAPAHTPTVGEALERPAVAVQAPQRAVLLGAARAGGRIVAVGERGVVAQSEDAGGTWHQAPSPVSVTLTAVRFADAEHGFAVGHGGTVLATADGGRSWARRLDGKRLAQLALETAKASGDAATLRDAQQLVADGPDKPLLDLLVLDARRAVVVGAYGVALATADAGATWQPWMARLDNPRGLHLYAIRRLGQRIVIAGEQGLVLQSGDGGQSFRRLALPYQGSFFTAELRGEQEIVVAGLRGNVWRSQDAGATWAQVASPVPVSVTASALRADGSLVLVNQAGLVLAERGGALVPLPAAPLPPLNAVLPLDGGALLALSVQGARRVDAAAPGAAASK